MRSSFNALGMTSKAAFALSALTAIVIACPFAEAYPQVRDVASGKTPRLMQPTRKNSQLLIAQGDASLPPPDPNYRNRRRAGQFGNGGLGEDPQVGPGGAPRRQFEQPGGNDNPDALMRRRRRERLEGAQGGAQGGPERGGSADGLRPQPFQGRRGGFPGLRPGAGAGLGAGAPDGVAPGMRIQRLKQFQAAGGGFLGKPLDFSSLNLSEDQKQRIRQMHQENGAKTKEIRQTLVSKRSELKDLMFDPAASDEQIRAKRKELRHLQDKVEEMQINDFLGIRSVLNPDQRQKLSDLKPGGAKFAAGNQPALIAPVETTPNRD